MGVSECGMVSGTGKEKNIIVAEDTPVSETEKVVSILFADIIGSTEALSVTLPNVSRVYIESQIQAMSSSVRKYGGEVIKTQGDGIIALFGHETGAEDHAIRAAYAGITMIRECRKIGESHSQVRYKGLRIGLHSGYAIISQFGNEAGAKLDTFGLAIHVASKLQTAAPADHICISKTAQALLTRLSSPKLYKLVSIGEGVDPISSYVIDAIHTTSADFPLKIGVSQNQIIGRDEEVAALEALLDFSNSKTGRGAVIIGTAGIGKTRVVDEISNKLAEQDVIQMVLAGVDVMKETPFFVVRQILISMALDEVSILTEAEREALEVLKSMDPLRMQSWRVPEYKKVTAISTGFLKIIEHLGQNHPVVLIAEDLHFFDEESLNFILKLLEFLETADRAAVIGTARPPLSDRLSKAFSASLQLAPLSQDQSERLALSIARQFPGEPDQPTIRSIISSSGGSPLSLTEFTKIQFGADGTSDNQIPLSIEPVMRNRLERLSPRAKVLVNLLCLVGKALNLETLKELNDLPLRDIEALMDECLSQGIMKETASGDYNFTHDLFRVACLNSLSPEDKVDLHGKIYGHLNSPALAQTSSPDIQLMARQAFGAGQSEEALRHFKSALAEANGLGAIRTVRSLFKQVDAFCDQIEDGPFHKARFAMLSFDATHRLAEEQALLPVYLEALEQDEQRFSLNELVVIRSQLAIIHWTTGQSFKGLAYASDAMRAVGETDHLGLEYIAVYTQACLEFSLGYLETAINRISRHVKKMPQEIARKKWGQSVSIPSVVLQTFGAWFATDAGDFQLANRFLKDASKTSEEYPNTYGFVLGQISQGYIFLRSKKYAEGSEVLCAAYEIAAVSTLSLATMSAAWAALCLIEIGEVDKAQDLLTQEFASGRPDVIRNANRVYIFLAKAKLEAALGNYEEAESWINRALSEGRANGDLITTAYCYADYAKILSVKNSPNPDRIRHLKNALNIAEQCGMHPLIAECKARLEY